VNEIGGKKMRKMIADELTALGGPAPHCLVGVDDAYDWSSGKKGPRIGTNYTILRVCDLEKVRVYVRDAAPVVDPTAFAGLTVSQFPKVSFDGFNATIGINSRTDQLSIYAEASAIKLITTEK